MRHVFDMIAHFFNRYGALIVLVLIFLALAAALLLCAMVILDGSDRTMTAIAIIGSSGIVGVEIVALVSIISGIRDLQYLP